MIYLLDIFGGEGFPDPAGHEGWKSFFPEGRYERILRLKKKEDRMTGAGAWLLLYYALKKYGIADLPGKYGFGTHGKPHRDGVFFNLSHSGRYVLCVVGETEVGCDVEMLRPVNRKLVRRFFSKKETELIEKLELCQREKGEKSSGFSEKNANRSAGEKNCGREEGGITEADRLYTCLWTLKESYAKKTGEGLAEILGDLCFAECVEAVLPGREKTLSGRLPHRIAGADRRGKALSEQFLTIPLPDCQIAVCADAFSPKEKLEETLTAEKLLYYLNYDRKI